MDGLLAADGAVRIPADLHFLEVHVQGVVEQQTPDQRIALAGDQLDGLGGLDRADHAGQHPEDAALGAARHGAGGRRGGEQAAVARRLLARHEHRGLSLELVDRSVDQRLAQELRGVVHEVTHREVVGAVDHDVVGPHDLHHVLGGEHRVVADEVDRGVERPQVLHADRTFVRPTSASVCRICRCRLDLSTTSKSMMPIVPMPAAARYSTIGEPSPPAPITSTLESSSFR